MSQDMERAYVGLLNAKYFGDKYENSNQELIQLYSKKYFLCKRFTPLETNVTFVSLNAKHFGGMKIAIITPLGIF